MLFIALRFSFNFLFFSYFVNFFFDRSCYYYELLLMLFHVFNWKIHLNCRYLKRKNNLKRQYPVYDNFPCEYSLGKIECKKHRFSIFIFPIPNHFAQTRNLFVASRHHTKRLHTFTVENVNAKSRNGFLNTDFGMQCSLFWLRMVKTFHIHEPYYIWNVCYFNNHMKWD